MSLDVTLYVGEEIVFDANITHNLNKMADAAGIYKHLWRPEEIGAVFAKDIIEPVEKGLIDMVLRPDYYKNFNSENGWGLYKNFVPWVSEYLNACKLNPNAKISVSR